MKIKSNLEVFENSRDARDVQAEASRRAPRAVNARAEELVRFPRVHVHDKYNPQTQHERAFQTHDERCELTRRL